MKSSTSDEFNLNFSKSDAVKYLYGHAIACARSMIRAFRLLQKTDHAIHDLAEHKNPNKQYYRKMSKEFHRIGTLNYVVGTTAGALAAYINDLKTFDLVSFPVAVKLHKLLKDDTSKDSDIKRIRKIIGLLSLAKRKALKTD